MSSIKLTHKETLKYRVFLGNTFTNRVERRTQTFNCWYKIVKIGQAVEAPKPIYIVLM